MVNSICYMGFSKPEVALAATVCDQQNVEAACSKPQTAVKLCWKVSFDETGPGTGWVSPLNQWRKREIWEIPENKKKSVQLLAHPQPETEHKHDFGHINQAFSYKTRTHSLKQDFLFKSYLAMFV